MPHSIHAPALLLGKVEHMLTDALSEKCFKSSAIPHSLFEICNSKHTREAFVEKFKEDPSLLMDLHDEIRFLGEHLWEISGLICDLKYEE